MLPEVKKNAGRRINRIAGQVNGIRKMIDDDRYCVDILNQISAVRAALDQLGVQILSGHLESCLLTADPEQHAELLQEIRQSLSQFIR